MSQFVRDFGALFARDVHRVVVYSAHESMRDDFKKELGPELWGPRPITLHGRNVRLEPLGPAHAADLLRAAADPEVWSYLPVPQPANAGELQALIASAVSELERGVSVPFAIIDLRSGRAVGSTRYLDIRRHDRGLEIGWTWLSSDVWRTAINTECKYLLLRHAFEDLSALRVQLKTDERNARSRAAILRIGAQFEGTLRCDRVMWNGFVRNSAYYSVVEREWPEVRAALEARLAR